MMGLITSNAIRFLILLGVQVFLLDHINLYDGFIVPYLYILFLFMLPFDIERSVLLLAGFITGLIMDMFNNTPGLHASACVLLAFVRPFVLNWLEPRDGYEFGLIPRLQHMGLPWFLTYVAILTLVHHLWLFFAEILTAQHMLTTLLRILLSSIFTIALCILAQFLTFSSRKS